MVPILIVLIFLQYSTIRLNAELHPVPPCIIRCNQEPQNPTGHLNLLPKASVHNIDMENILAGTQYEHLDPSTPLTNVDIIRLLMEYCNKTVKEHNRKVREDLENESKHTDDKLKLVVSGLGHKIDNITNLILGYLVCIIISTVYWSLLVSCLSYKASMSESYLLT